MTQHGSAHAGGWGTIAMAAIMLMWAKYIILFVLLALWGFSFYHFAKWWIARRDAKAVEREAIAWRAEEQDLAYQYGIYGEYQPATEVIYDYPEYPAYSDEARPWYDYERNNE